MDFIDGFISIYVNIPSFFGWFFCGKLVGAFLLAFILMMAVIFVGKLLFKD